MWRFLGCFLWIEIKIKIKFRIGYFEKDAQRTPPVGARGTVAMLEVLRLGVPDLRSTPRDDVSQLSQMTSGGLRGSERES